MSLSLLFPRTPSLAPSCSSACVCLSLCLELPPARKTLPSPLSLVSDRPTGVWELVLLDQRLDFRCVSLSFMASRKRWCVSLDDMRTVRNDVEQRVPLTSLTVMAVCGRPSETVTVLVTCERPFSAMRDSGPPSAILPGVSLRCTASSE